MTHLDAEAIRQLLGEAAIAKLTEFDVFPEIESTNSYLMQQAGPPTGQLSVAVTDNQTMGRGRHGRSWASPAGSGLCLSLAYTYAVQPPALSALTLAIGLGVIEALEASGIAGVELKWPNDLMLGEGKLGGILTESLPRSAGQISIVTGVGLNINLGDISALDLDAGSTRRIADLASVVENVPTHCELAARVIDHLCATFMRFEASGFSDYAEAWAERDWLLGREVVINTPQSQVAGTGAGIDSDGALLVDTGIGRITRITSGSVVLA